MILVWLLSANRLLTDPLASDRTQRDDSGRERGKTAGQTRFRWTGRYWPGRGSSVFKSPLAHRHDPWVDLGLCGIRGRFKGPIVAPLWHRLSSEALAWHGLKSDGAPMAA